MNRGQYEGLLKALEEIRDRLSAGEPVVVHEHRASCHGPIGELQCGLDPGDPEPRIVLTTHHLDGSKTVATTGPQGSNEFRAGVSAALYHLMVNLDGWIEGAHDNHEALNHPGEIRGSECWTEFHPADIRRMINDVARELSVAEFPLPKTPKEDQVR